MASSNWSRVRQLVEEALEIPPPERPRWLDSACGADQALREEVEGLLAAEDDAERLGESPFPGVIASAVPATFAQPELGARIGSYELVRVIASGGMGTVYEALQRSPQRKVALKVMRESLVTAAERSRFRFEAEVLARLQHPNIAQIYESGVQVEGERGHRRETPYFAMEFVEGHRTLLEYASEHELGLDARAKLFQQVCDAVHHGHQKGVIHRDIKPSNLLVTPAGQVKVIDFGVARAIVQEGAARTLQTQSGQLIGTLAYMSPEQFGADPNAIDVRSDVYALGTVLYELVVGSLPFALEGKALHEVANIVTFERPRRPRSLKPGLPAEIEWLLLKTLEKEPRLRYASASELALDLGRFLDHQPVLAGAPSVIHRVKLAIRRNRAASAIGAAALLAILVSGAFYLRSLAQARASEEQQLYVAMVAAADASLRVGDVAGARGFLERAPSKLRNWEWHHLDARRDESVRTWQEKGQLTAFRPRTGTLTSGGEVKHVYEWSNGLDQEPRTVLELEASWSTTAMAWSHDGSVLALGSHDGGVRIYRVEGEVRLLASVNLAWKIHDIDFSTDDELIAVAGESSLIHVLDARTAGELAALVGHRSEVYRALFDPTGARIYSSSTDGTVRAWEWRAGVQRVLSEFSDDVLGLVLSEDGRTLAAGSSDGSVRVLDLAGGREIQRFDGLGSGVQSVAMVRGSTLILCGLGDGSIEALDASTGARVRALFGHESVVMSISVAPDGATVATGAFDNEVKQWNLRAPGCATVVRAHWGDAGAMFDPQGRWLVTVGFRDLLVCVRDAGTGRLVRVLLDPLEAIRSASFSSDGEWFAVGGASGDVRTWTTSDFESTWMVPARSDPVDDPHRRLRFQGSRLLLRHADGRLERWRIGVDAPDRRIGGLTPGHGLAVDAQSLRVALGGQDGSVTLLEAAGLEVSWSNKPHTVSTDLVAFSPEGGTIVSVDIDNTIVLQDASTGRVLRRASMTGAQGTVYPLSVSYSPDGSRLAIGSTSGLLRLFDARTLEVVLSLRCDNWVGAEFVPDGDTLAAVTSSGTLMVWRGGRPRTGEPELDLEPSLLARADQVFADMRSRTEELEDVLTAIGSDRELEPALKEAVLERAHAERASKGELLHRAMQMLVARDSAPDRMHQAIARARGVRRVENSDPEAILAQAIARLRDGSLEDADRSGFALSGLERAERAALERGDRVWAAARAGQAIALAHLGRSDEARVRLAEARACAKFEPGWAALLAEADALLAVQPAK